MIFFSFKLSTLNYPCILIKPCYLKMYFLCTFIGPVCWFFFEVSTQSFMLATHSTTWATPAAFLSLVSFQAGSSVLTHGHCWTDVLLPTTSYIARTTGMNHHTLLFKGHLVFVSVLLLYFKVYAFFELMYLFKILRLGQTFQKPLCFIGHFQKSDLEIVENILVPLTDFQTHLNYCPYSWTFFLLLLKVLSCWKLRTLIESSQWLLALTFKWQNPHTFIQLKIASFLHEVFFLDD
jgi:hypothetical protein